MMANDLMMARGSVVFGFGCGNMWKLLWLSFQSPLMSFALPEWWMKSWRIWRSKPFVARSKQCKVHRVEAAGSPMISTYPLSRDTDMHRDCLQTNYIALIPATRVPISGPACFSVLQRHRDKCGIWICPADYIQQLSIGQDLARLF